MSKLRKSNYLSCYSPQVQQQAQALMDREKARCLVVEEAPSDS